MSTLPKCFRSFKLAALCGFLILILDRLSKCWILDNFYYGQQMKVLPFLNFTFIKNKGVTFGLLSGVLSSKMLFLLALAVLIFFVYWTLKNKEFFLAAGFIVGGAIGNLFDRFYYGGVVDFIDFYVYNYHWPAFNIADAGVVIGVFLIIVQASNPVQDA